MRAAEQAAVHLSAALHLARVADCPKLIPKIRKAITSAGGAVRHVNHRANRTDKRGRALHPWTGKPYGSDKDKRAQKPVVHAWQTRADLK